ncbi:MAG: hypothetical protein H0W64_08485 [Gammaproteobacteria bacterium]|nr:hypothetical protein [Gammaproteobacteria bacterium]
MMRRENTQTNILVQDEALFTEARLGKIEEVFQMIEARADFLSALAGAIVGGQTLLTQTLLGKVNINAQIRNLVLRSANTAGLYFSPVKILDLIAVIDDAPLKKNLINHARTVNPFLHQALLKLEVETAHHQGENLSLFFQPAAEKKPELEMNRSTLSSPSV